MSQYPAKGRADYYEPGDWNYACAQCGRKRKASMVRQLPVGVPGAGLYVCFPEHWDMRHPQELVRGIPDRPAAPYVLNQQDAFINFCTPNSSSAIPDWATPDCSVPDYLSPAFDPDFPS